MCDQLDGFETALTDGGISAEQLDGVAAIIRNLDDDTRREFTAAPELLDAASTNTVATFNRQCRDLARFLATNRPGSAADELDRQRANVTIKRWVDKITGMCHTHWNSIPCATQPSGAASTTSSPHCAQADSNARTPSRRWLDPDDDRG